MELKCEEKRGVSDNYKLFVLGTLKKGIIGESIEGARRLLVINTTVVDKLKLRLNISIKLHMLCIMCDLPLVLKIKMKMFEV